MKFATIKCQITTWILLLPIATLAQDSLWKSKPAITLTGFADVFFMYDFAKPSGNIRQPFFYSYNRHNEFNLNLGLIKISVEHAKYRANLAFHSGTYSNDNYAEEPGLLKNILEANVGISLNRKNNLWLDMGVLPSHIGFESAISVDNWTLTRSILADNSPYFETGAKLTYNPRPNVELAGLILNGWQRIQRQPGKSIPSFGSQVKFTLNDNFTFNWSTYIGNEGPDSNQNWRLFSNFYCMINENKKVSAILGFDIGVQQFIFFKQSQFWYSPVIILRAKINAMLALAIRAEYYKTDVLIMPMQFRTTGFSLNFDYSPVDFIKLRAEARWLYSPERIYKLNNYNSNHNIVLGCSMAIRISKRL